MASSHYPLNTSRTRRWPPPKRDHVDNQHDSPLTQVELWNMGEDHSVPKPREWLMGRTYCRGYVSGIAAAGGTGKTALRILQALAVATGRELTGERLYGRFRVLYVALEDDRDEIRRRVWAATKHHEIPRDDLLDCFYLATPMGMKIGELSPDNPREVMPGELERWLRHVIAEKRIDLVVIDPFVKIHTVDENDNGLVDQVLVILARLAINSNCAIDLLHHQPKGLGRPGDANRARGASALRDGIRVLDTLTPMDEKEGPKLGLSESETRRLMRIDSAKTNLMPPPQNARWYRFVDVALRNRTPQYPDGDRIQTCEVWAPPGVNASGITAEAIERIFDQLQAGPTPGRHYTRAGNAKEERQAWRMMKVYWPTLTKPQAEGLLKNWLKDGCLSETEYHDPKTRHKAKGLTVLRRP